MTTIFTQNGPWLSFCEFSKLCKQFFLSQIESQKYHMTQLSQKLKDMKSTLGPCIQVGTHVSGEYTYKEESRPIGGLLVSYSYLVREYVYVMLIQDIV